MGKYRTQLPQTTEDLMLTDGGLETTLIFDDGFDLPLFASFPLLDRPDGRAALDSYFGTYAGIARDQDVGVVLETPTWRASADWGVQLGYDAVALADINRRAVDLLQGVRETHETYATPVVISGNLGPRGDGYDPGVEMTRAEAEAYHQAQVDSLAAAGADLVTVLTMNYVAEAIGVTRAAANAGIPVVVSFTVETDGHLPTGQPLAAAIAEVEASTGGYPVFYGVNCAHPTHFDHVLPEGEDWLGLIGLVRANASKLSHAELDEATELDPGDPTELGGQYAALRRRLPNLRVVGGCCGTDHRHVAAVGRSCVDAVAVA